MKKRIVIFTGAGISAESGLATFRNSDGLWAKYRIEDVCTPEALANNRELVVEFYNMRRREMLNCEPNAAHKALAKLEEHFDVEVVTQNVDNLHERGGSTSVLHLHGELTKLRSTANPNLIYPIEGWEQPLDECAEDGSPLRPYIVFFGEAVPMFDRGVELTKSADLMIVVGSSLAVYPAASLLHYLKKGAPIYLVDPNCPTVTTSKNSLTYIQKTATEGVPELVDMLINEYSN